MVGLGFKAVIILKTLASHPQRAGRSWRKLGVDNYFFVSGAG
jgi:hypothetical protein